MRGQHHTTPPFPGWWIASITTLMIVILALAIIGLVLTGI